MCAVLRIITADQVLSDAAFRHVNILADSIDWEPVLRLDLGPGHNAAIQFAYAIWSNQIRPNCQLFEEALSMSPELKRACARALSIRWNL